MVNEFVREFDRPFCFIGFFFNSSWSDSQTYNFVMNRENSSREIQHVRILDIIFLYTVNQKDISIHTSKYIQNIDNYC